MWNKFHLKMNNQQKQNKTNQRIKSLVFILRIISQLNTFKSVATQLECWSNLFLLAGCPSWCQTKHIMCARANANISRISLITQTEPESTGQFKTYSSCMWMLIKCHHCSSEWMNLSLASEYLTRTDTQGEHAILSLAVSSCHWWLIASTGQIVLLH